MIRRRLSTGALRSLNFGTALTPASPSTSVLRAAVGGTAPASAQAQGLASAVLLSSQRNWKLETVQTIKAELKKRGLSQAGNKASLIARIQSADTTAMLPPIPTPSSKPPTRPRSLSTTSPARSSRTAPLSAPAPAAPAAPASSEHVASTGPAISSQRTEAPKVQPIKPEEITVAPGLPKTKDANTAAPSAEKLDIKLPTFSPPAESAPEIEQVIPFTPDNFLSKQSTTAAPESTTPSGPKVMTVASAATHPAGGPVHGIHEASDSHSHELDTSSEGDAVFAAASDAFPSIGSLLNGIFVLGPSAAWRSTGLEMPAFGVPEAPKSKPYEPSSRPLDSDERTGAWILAGIIAGALLIGGPGKDKKDKHDASHSHATGEAHGAKGDAQWEKASGAGVVGHGSRKD